MVERSAVQSKITTAEKNRGYLLIHKPHEWTEYLSPMNS